MILAELKNTPLLQSCHMALLPELKPVVWARGGYFHTLPIRVCAVQRGRDLEAPDLERGIHFRGVFWNGV